MKKLIRRIVNWAYGYDLGDVIATTALEHGELKTEFEKIKAERPEFIVDKG